MPWRVSRFCSVVAFLMYSANWSGREEASAIDTSSCMTCGGTVALMSADADGEAIARRGWRMFCNVCFLCNDNSCWLQQLSIAIWHDDQQKEDD